MTTSSADNKVFICKPIAASVKLSDGKFYNETIDDKTTPLIDQLSISQFQLNDDEIYYKNNKDREFEQLIPSDYFIIKESNNDKTNLFLEIWNVFSQWDQKLNLKGFKTYIYPYRTSNDVNYDLSMKRISIHNENFKTSEITVPITQDRPSYLIERACEVETKVKEVEYFFDKSFGKNLS